VLEDVDSDPGLSGFGAVDKALIALIVEIGSVEVVLGAPPLTRGFWGVEARETSDAGVGWPAEGGAATELAVAALRGEVPSMMETVVPPAVGLVVLPAAVGGRDVGEEGRAPVVAGTGVWLVPEAVEPEGPVEELAGAEPVAGGGAVPVAAGVAMGAVGEPLLGAETGACPASI